MQSRELFEQAERQLAAIPGVNGVTSVMVPLIGGDQWVWGNSLIVGNYAGRGNTLSLLNEVAPGFFGQMGIPLVRGREFTEGDNFVGHKVAIVNERFAKTFFAGQNPLGRKFGIGVNPNAIPDIEIVGVVKDSHYSSVKQPPPETYYTPWRQDKEIGWLTFYVRSTLPSDQVAAQVRKVAQSLDGSLPLEDLRTMEEQVSSDVFEDRFIFQLVAIFAVQAIALAMMGIYGVMANGVTQRKREIGIRMAIGAKPAGIRQMVLREMLLIMAVGLGLGIPAALVVSKVVQSQLFDVKIYDPLVVAGASFALGLAAFAAAYLPAWRASRIDPLIALRCE